MTAEFEARDALWADAVAIAEEAAAKANAQIQLRCAELGIPPKCAPGLQLGWWSRSSEFANRDRRAELRKLAEAKAAAVTKAAKTAIQSHALISRNDLSWAACSLTRPARSRVAAHRQQLMPTLCLEDLGVKRWQPPEDIATQLTTPMTPHSGASGRSCGPSKPTLLRPTGAIAQIASCDHKTVAAYRRERGEIPAISGESPTEEDPS